MRSPPLNIALRLREWNRIKAYFDFVAQTKKISGFVTNDLAQVKKFVNLYYKCPIKVVALVN